MDAATLALLEADNPWLRDPAVFDQTSAHRIPERLIPRLALRLARWPERGRAHLLVGARQVGKSTLLWNRFREAGTPPLFLNAEEPALRLWLRSPALVRQALHGLLASQTPVLIDEAQHLDEAGLFIKGLIDGGLSNPLYVTGSSAFHLEATTRESLAGRASRVRLDPLSLVEVSQDLPSSMPPLLRTARVRERALRQAVIGSYPAVWLSDDPDRMLYYLLEAFVIRDASDLFHVEHLDAFRRLIGLSAGQVGSLVNYSEWGGICGISRNTVRSYVDVLAQTHIVHEIAPFVGGRRAELTGRRKLYFCDNGLRNAALRQLSPFGIRPDRGALLENWVGAELRKHLDPLAPMDTLRYWRSKSGAEVDFVFETADGLVAVEVKATQMPRPRLSRSARSFIDAYGPQRFFVVNLSLEAREIVGLTDVLWVTPDALSTPKRFGLDRPTH